MNRKPLDDDNKMDDCATERTRLVGGSVNEDAIMKSVDNMDVQLQHRQMLRDEGKRAQLTRNGPSGSNGSRFVGPSALAT